VTPDERPPAGVEDSLSTVLGPGARRPTPGMVAIVLLGVFGAVAALASVIGGVRADNAERAQERRDRQTLQAVTKVLARNEAILRELIECNSPSPKPQPPPGVVDVRDPEDIHECIEERSARTGDAVAAAQCTTILLSQPRPARWPANCTPTYEYLVGHGVLP
jgi:hypothetical protein